MSTPPAMPSDPRLLLLSPGDSVFVLRGAVEAGEVIAVEGRPVRLPARLGLGHKIARRDIAPGEKVIKYGAPIGSASRAITTGEHVHVHNLQSDYTATHDRGGGPAAGGTAEAAP